MKPILFNAEMVKAILDGRKTATRRIMKPQPLFYTGRKYIFTDDVCPKKWEDCSNIIETYQYQPGDILYVRETYCPNYFDDCVARHRNGNRNAYKADYHKEIVDDVVPEPKWKPSIHMPKKAARIFLKVTDVRVERLWGITLEGIAKEGINPKHFEDENGVSVKDFVNAYISLWDSTIKNKDRSLYVYGWNANPYVWVIEFERCEKPESEGI